MVEKLKKSFNKKRERQKQIKFHAFYQCKKNHLNLPFVSTKKTLRNAFIFVF